jgi:hypothetical protein
MAFAEVPPGEDEKICDFSRYPTNGVVNIRGLLQRAEPLGKGANADSHSRYTLNLDNGCAFDVRAIQSIKLSEYDGYIVDITGSVAMDRQWPTINASKLIPIGAVTLAASVDAETPPCGAPISRADIQQITRVIRAVQAWTWLATGEGLEGNPSHICRCLGTAMLRPVGLFSGPALRYSDLMRPPRGIRPNKKRRETNDRYLPQT